MRQRSVSCRLPSGQLSPGCNKENKPTAREGCNIRPCPTWITGDWGKVRRHFYFTNSSSLEAQFFLVSVFLFLWSIFGFHHCWLFRLQCSVTCGAGIKIRSVECSDKDFSCNEITKPQAKTRCNLKECPEWKTSPWEEVSEHLHGFSEEHFALIKSIRSFFFFHKTGCIRHGWSLKYTGRVSWLAEFRRIAAFFLFVFQTSE